MRKFAVIRLFSLLFDVVRVPFLQHLGWDKVTPLLHPFQVSIFFPEVVGEHLWDGLHCAPYGVPSPALWADQESRVHLEEVQESIEGVDVLRLIF